MKSCFSGGLTLCLKFNQRFSDFILEVGIVLHQCIDRRLELALQARQRRTLIIQGQALADQPVCILDLFHQSRKSRVRLVKRELFGEFIDKRLYITCQLAVVLCDLAE